jgi:hypothetical protein
VRHIYLSLFFCCNFAANASACVADAEFIRERNSETLVACLEGPEGEVFLTERSLELATVLHLAVETEKDRLVNRPQFEPPPVCRRLITSSHATISNALNCA